MNKLYAIAGVLVVAIVVLMASGADAWMVQRMLALPEPFRAACAHMAEMGKSEYYLVGSLLIGAYFGRRALKDPDRNEVWMQRAMRALYVFACIAVAGLMTDVIKFVVGRARPKEWFEHNLPDGALSFDPFTLDSRWHSFPSGHANTMAAFIISVLPFVPSSWRGPILGGAAAIAAARPITAAHYPSDILAGTLVAIIVCAAMEHAARKKMPRLFA